MAIEIVRRVYECFAQGDMDGFLQLCDEKIEWVVNGPASLVKCRSYEGLEGVRTFLDILERTWSFSSFTPREFIDCGGKVVVLGEEAGTDRKTDERFENRWAHIFTVRNDRVVSFREFLCHWRDNQHPPTMSWQ